MTSYFWDFGRCKHCGWGSHLRQDHPEKRTLFRRRLKRPAMSIVWCHNCRTVTTIEPYSNPSPAARQEDRS